MVLYLCKIASLGTKGGILHEYEPASSAKHSSPASEEDLWSKQSAL